ncbi:hypothetical protein [Paenibacillus sp. FSL F4-0243]
MIMPEHENRLLDDALNQKIHTNPDLIPQALVDISQVLAQSLEDYSQ